MRFQLIVDPLMGQYIWDSVALQAIATYPVLDDAMRHCEYLNSEYLPATRSY